MRSVMRSPFCATGGSGMAPGGSGKPRAEDILLQRGIFAAQPRDLIFEHGAILGAAWQAQPTVCWLHSETSPVCVSSRTKPSADFVEGIAPAGVVRRRVVGKGRHGQSQGGDDDGKALADHGHLLHADACEHHWTG